MATAPYVGYVPIPGMDLTHNPTFAYPLSNIIPSSRQDRIDDKFNRVALLNIFKTNWRDILDKGLKDLSVYGAFIDQAAGNVLPFLNVNRDEEYERDFIAVLAKWAREVATWHSKLDEYAMEEFIEGQHSKFPINIGSEAQLMMPFRKAAIRRAAPLQSIGSEDSGSEKEPEMSDDMPDHLPGHEDLTGMWWLRPKPTAEWEAPAVAIEDREWMNEMFRALCERVRI